MEVGEGSQGTACCGVKWEEGTPRAPASRRGPCASRPPACALTRAFGLCDEEDAPGPREELSRRGAFGSPGRQDRAGSPGRRPGREGRPPSRAGAVLPLPPGPAAPARPSGGQAGRKTAQQRGLLGSSELPGPERLPPAP